MGLLLTAVVAVSSLASAHASWATETQPPAEAVHGTVVEFRNVPPDPKGSYAVECTVTLIDSPRKYSIKLDVGANTSPLGWCAAFRGPMKREKGWEYEVDEGKITVRGWRDPATNQLHPVKEVKFTSDDLPKELLPKVTYPQQQKA